MFHLDLPARRHPAGFAAILALSAMLTGCAENEAGRYPYTFAMTKHGDTVTGTYDPVGFTSEEVRYYASSSWCNSDQIASYRESPRHGKIAFTLICKDA